MEIECITDWQDGESVGTLAWEERGINKGRRRDMKKSMGRFGFDYRIATSMGVVCGYSIIESNWPSPNVISPNTYLVRQHKKGTLVSTLMCEDARDTRCKIAKKGCNEAKFLEIRMLNLHSWAEKMDSGLTWNWLKIEETECQECELLLCMKGVRGTGRTKSGKRSVMNLLDMLEAKQRQQCLSSVSAQKECQNVIGPRKSW